MAVRSKRLAAGNVSPGSPAVVYTCPTGYRTIIKTISAFNVAVSFNRLYVRVQAGATILGYLVVPLAANPGLSDTQHVNVFQVVNAGETLVVDTNSISVHYVISGAELLL